MSSLRKGKNTSLSIIYYRHVPCQSTFVHEIYIYTHTHTHVYIHTFSNMKHCIIIITIAYITLQITNILHIQFS